MIATYLYDRSKQIKQYRPVGSVNSFGSLPHQDEILRFRNKTSVSHFCTTLVLMVSPTEDQLVTHEMRAKGHEFLRAMCPLLLLHLMPN
jgi:hypothetical protein